ncbi:hypothetical protein ACFL5F_02480 [Planctomycetota bacterium]
MDNQLGFSELLQGILGSEKKILSGHKDMLHFAMRVDELEELLEQDDIYALFWVNEHIKKKGRAEFLKDLENDYIEARGSYDETNSIEGIKRHFVDGMQYVYCYLKGLPANENMRADAVKRFLSGRTKHNLGRMLVAYAIGFLIEAMLEE